MPNNFKSFEEKMSSSSKMFQTNSECEKYSTILSAITNLDHEQPGMTHFRYLHAISGEKRRVRGIASGEERGTRRTSARCIRRSRRAKAR